MRYVRRPISPRIFRLVSGVTSGDDWLKLEIESLPRRSQDEIDVHFLTFVFVMFIFFAATQDIAVDGWALTLLSGSNLSYASTAQTIGLTIGSTLSNTVFLALNSVEFSNTWLRRVPSIEPAITLEGYLKFWAGVYLVFTLWLAFGKKEEPTSDDDPDLDVRKVYTVMGSILKLKSECTLPGASGTFLR
jgi:PAT family acetyl-CoA transporter-like MFS transporter 1